MRFYKTLISFGILLLLYSNSAYSQLILSGQVRDNYTYVGVPSHQVSIIGDTTYLNTPAYNNTVYTDNQGFFTDTILILPGPSKYYIITLDCNQNPVIDSIFSAFPASVSLDICTGGINMCISDFVAYYDTANYQLIHFFNLSSSNTNSYIWNFGDGNYAVAKNPNHQYNLGSYLVCLTVSDSSSNCTDIYCDSITISPSMNCHTDFTYSLIASKKYSFVANINNIYPTIYEWDFGDYSYTNGKNVVHQYQQPGTYTVKLKSTSFHPQTLDTCIAFSQKVIQVGGAPTAGIWGQVFADSSIIDHGIVYLYSYNQTNNTLSMVDSSIVHSVDSMNISYYLFYNLNYGKYSAYLKLLPNSVFAQDYGPGYAGNTIYWDNSQIINLNQASNNLPINLTHLYKQNGSSSISGHVYEGNKKASGNPVAGIPLFLLDNASVVVDFQYSQSDGSYSFHNLSPQKYFIYSDVINHSIYPADAIITLQNQNINNINIYIGSSIVTALREEQLPSDFKIYPNPASQNIKLEYNNPEAQIVSYKITNIVGQNILSKSFQAKSGFNTTDIDISSFNAGVYIFAVKSYNKTIYREKLIISK